MNPPNLYILQSWAIHSKILRNLEFFFNNMYSYSYSEKNAQLILISVAI